MGRGKRRRKRANAAEYDAKLVPTIKPDANSPDGVAVTTTWGPTNLVGLLQQATTTGGARFTMEFHFPVKGKFLNEWDRGYRFGAEDAIRQLFLWLGLEMEAYHTERPHELLLSFTQAGPSFKERIEEARRIRARHTAKRHVPMIPKSLHNPPLTTEGQS